MQKPAKVIETSKIVYGALLFSWVFAAFMSSALVAQEGGTSGAVLIAGPIVGILFSATGILRPKRIKLDVDMLVYRPVWGPTLMVRKCNIETFDVFVLNATGSGFLICKMRSEAFKDGMFDRHNLGFALMPQEVLKPLRRWLGRSS